MESKKKRGSKMQIEQSDPTVRFLGTSFEGKIAFKFRTIEKRGSFFAFNMLSHRGSVFFREVLASGEPEARGNRHKGRLVWLRDRGQAKCSKLLTPNFPMYNGTPASSRRVGRRRWS